VSSFAASRSPKVRALAQILTSGAAAEPSRHSQAQSSRHSEASGRPAGRSLRIQSGEAIHDDITTLVGQRTGVWNSGKMSATSRSLLLAPGSFGSKVGLACAYTLLGLAAIEIGYRIHTDRPAFALKSWRADQIEYRTFGDRAIFDAALGWTSKEWYGSESYSTLDHGIRRNLDEDTIRAGAILAVGATFANGSYDVDDDDTWPAQLERALGTPVLNGGVEGYATDQIVMRAERLLPLVRPKTLVVGFVEEDIARAGHSSFGASKPYFTLDGRELHYHPPVPVTVHDQSEPAWRARARDVLQYSAVIDVVLARLAPDYWLGSAGQEVFQKVDNDPIGVTCALLLRLKTRSDADAVRLLLFMQYAWPTIAEKDAPGADAQQVAACAEAAGIEVVDQFASLRAIAVADRSALRELYVEEGDVYAPLSSKGNEQAAGLLAHALRK